MCVYQQTTREEIHACIVRNDRRNQWILLKFDAEEGKKSFLSLFQDREFDFAQEKTNDKPESVKEEKIDQIQLDEEHDSHKVLSRHTRSVSMPIMNEEIKIDTDVHSLTGKQSVK